MFSLMNYLLGYHLDQLFDQLVHAKWFSIIDLRTGYWQIRLGEEDQEKTAMRTRFGLFHWLVMPMGITNAVENFQSLMLTIFKEYLDKLVVIFIDDLVIFSKTFEDHKYQSESCWTVERRLADTKPISDWCQ